MSFDLLFNKANELYLNGAYQEAENVYRQILAFAPENPDILNMLGLIAAAKQEHNIAVSYFYKALKKAPNPLPIYFNLAVSLTAMEKYDEAVEAYKHVLKLAPQTKEAYNNLGGVYEKKEEFTEAERCYQKALEIDKNDINAAVNLAVLQKNQEKLLEIAKQNKTSALPLYYLALFSFDEGCLSEALEFALKSNEREEAYDIKNLIAQIYIKQENKTQAVKYFHQALLLNPKSVDALVNLGTLEDDESYFKKALSLSPNNPEAHLSYADFLSKQNKKAQALEEYRQALLLGKDNAALSNNMALILKDMCDYKGALDLLFNAFIKDPKNKNISINMAETLVLLHEQEPQEALRIARLWCSNAPNNVFANKTLASFEKNESDNDQEYAKALFDEFASLYDERMNDIEYNVLNKIKELKINFKGKILDLGCGTGLAAEALKEEGSTWTGVDISEKMLQKAKQKGLYNDLLQIDALEFLEKNNLKFNIVLCLDVIEYIGNFEKLINCCFPSVLVLSIEKAPDEVKTFSVSPQGRYQHKPEYIINLLKESGYTNIQNHPLILRKENGKDVEGGLFICSTETFSSEEKQN